MCAQGFPSVLVELRETNPAVSIHMEVADLGAPFGVKPTAARPTVRPDQPIRQARHRLVVLPDGFDDDLIRRSDIVRVLPELPQGDLGTRWPARTPTKLELRRLELAAFECGEHRLEDISRWAAARQLKLAGELMAQLRIVGRRAYGYLEEWISTRLRIVTITFEDGAVSRLQIGDLDPPQTVRGAGARLMSLGYASPGASLAVVLESFQLANGLEPTAQLDDTTVAALVDAFGR